MVSQSKKEWKWQVKKHNCFTFCVDVLGKAGYNVDELQAKVDLPRVVVNKAKKAEK